MEKKITYEEACELVEVTEIIRVDDQRGLRLADTWTSPETATVTWVYADEEYEFNFGPHCELTYDSETGKLSNGADAIFLYKASPV